MAHFYNFMIGRLVKFLNTGHMGCLAACKHVFPGSMAFWVLFYLQLLRLSMLVRM
jgi:hypothetical protein